MYSSLLHCLNKRSLVLGSQNDWDWVLRDPVVGVFAPALFLMEKEGLLNLSDSLREMAKGIFFLNTALWIHKKAQLVSILKTLDLAEIEVLPLKGADLVDRVYKTEGVRTMADVDILVKPQDFVRAAEIMLEAGFQPGWVQENRDPFAFTNLPQEFWPEEVFFITNRGLIIDLHRHLVAFHWFKIAFPFAIEDIWGRRQKLGEPTWKNTHDHSLWQAQLSDYDMLAHLCLHLAFHSLREIKGFYDIDLFIKNLPADWDWSDFLEIVSDWQIRNAAYHAFLFTHHIFNTPIPPEVMADLYPGRLLRTQMRCLITPEALLEEKRTLGKLLPPLVTVALIDSLKLQRQSLFSWIFPDQIWLKNNPDYHSIWAHWAFIVRRLLREL